jgi:CRISPR-associated protein Cmr4
LPKGHDKLHLEVFQLEAQVSEPLMQISQWLAENALPQDSAYEFFRDKLKDDLVLLPDDDFAYFVRNATVVEPHVRINDETGTAESGGLFYTENLPPESLLLAPLMVSKERSTETRRNGADAMDAIDVLETVLNGNAENKPGLNELLLQVGGDATTGRGQVVVRAV